MPPRQHSSSIRNNSKPHAVVAGNLNLVRCLGHANIPVFCATSDANRAAFYSRYVSDSHKTPSPTLFPGDFIEELIVIGRTKLNGKAVLFYDGDGDLIAISKNRDKLKDYYLFLIPEHSLIDVLLDKQHFSTLAKTLGLNVPKTFFAGKGDLEFTGLSDIDFPILVKPQTRVGWLENSASWEFAQGGKAFRVRDRMDLDKLLENMKGFDGGMILQQLIPGPETQVFSYHAFINQSGTILSEYCGRKHATYPLEFGRSAFIEVFDNAVLTTLGRDYVGRVGLTGVVKLDFKYDTRSDSYFLLEINPRFSIWNWAGAVAGRNLPGIAYQALANENMGADEGRLTNVFWVDGRAYRKAAYESGKPWQFISGLFNKKIVFNILYLRDPLPFAISNWIKLTDLLKRVVKKLFPA